MKEIVQPQSEKADMKPEVGKLGPWKATGRGRI